MSFEFSESVQAGRRRKPVCCKARLAHRTANAGTTNGGTTNGGTTNGGAGNAGGPGEGIVIDGRGVFVDGEPLHLRGVCWNPVPQGAGHPSGLDYAGLYRNLPYIGVLDPEVYRKP